MKHTISVLVENHFGVLANIAGLFSARGFNIDSLSVGETEDPTVSRITVVIDAGEDESSALIVDEVMRQLNKLVDVIKVHNLTKEDFVDRELALVRIRPKSVQERSEIMQIVDIFRGKILDVGSSTLTLEITGDENKVRGMLDLLQQFDIRELVRSGRVAITRGKKQAKQSKKKLNRKS